MQIQDIYTFFQTPKPTFLGPEAAVCYVLHILLQGDSYGTELLRRLETEYPDYKLSGTIFCTALQFLETEHLIIKYQSKPPGRGRPRHMLKLHPDKQFIAQELAQFWQGYVIQRNYTSHQSSGRRA